MVDGACPSGRREMMRLKAVTFNIRCDYGQDGSNNFSFRKQYILKKIREEMPDVIGFQEVLPHVAAWLRDNLEGYCVIGCGREKDLSGEQATIAYRKDRLNLIAMDTFWISETPRVPGSRYEDQSTCPRTCTDAMFVETESGRVVRVLNTHLDHLGSGARVQGMKQIMAHLKNGCSFGDVPVLFMGDLNAEPDSPEIQMMKQEPEFVNVTEGIGATFHDYGRDAQTIDYMFQKGFAGCSRVYKWEEMENGVYLSDHYPVCAELEWDERER